MATFQTVLTLAITLIPVATMAGLTGYALTAGFLQPTQPTLAQPEPTLAQPEPTEPTEVEPEPATTEPEPIPTTEPTLAQPEPAEPTEPTPPTTAMTVKQLKAIAKSRGLVGYSRLNKAELIQAIAA